MVLYYERGNWVGGQKLFYFINFSHLNIKTDIKFQKNDN